MEDCHICLLSVPINTIEKLLCSHTLCHYCYTHLQKHTCPFCRAPFEYKYDNNDNNIIIDIQYSGLFHRQTRRRRRRNLTQEEIIERRRIIRERCRCKWEMKNKRLLKLNI